MGKSVLVAKVERWVKDLSPNAEHLIRTAYWVKVLKPDADEALVIAALAHDIERAFTKNRKPPSGEWNDAKWDDPIYNKWHPNRSARFLKRFLKEQGADPKLIFKSCELVKLHENGGSFLADILKDADSISFLEVNVPFFISKIPDVITKDEGRNKFDYMYHRISGIEAKRIAEPLYAKAIKALENH